VVAVALADGDVAAEDVGPCVDVDDVRDAVVAGDDADGELAAHPLSTTAQDTMRTGTDERLVLERGTGRGTCAVLRDRV